MTKRVVAWTMTCAVLIAIVAELWAEMRLVRQQKDDLAEYQRMTVQEP